MCGAKQNTIFIHQFPLAGRWQAISGKAEPKPQMSLPPPFLSLCCWSLPYTAWNTSLVNWGQLSWLCPLLSQFVAPSLFTWGGSMRNKVSVLSRHCSAIAETGVLPTVLLSNPKHSTTQATVQKINSIPDRPNQHIIWETSTRKEKYKLKHDSTVFFIGVRERLCKIRALRFWNLFSFQ